MGIKGLYSYLKYYRCEIDPFEAGNSIQGPYRIGIDAMSVLYRYKGDTDEIISILRDLRAAGHTIFFVFDGKPPVEKEREVQARKDIKAEAASSAASIEAFLATPAAAELGLRDREILEQSLGRCQASAWHMTRDKRRAFQEILWLEGIPYVKSLGEADDVLVDLVNAGKLDVILSTDMDFLMFGAKRLWIPTRRGSRIFEEVCLDAVLKGEGMDAAMFADACLLCGTEERQGLRGIPPHTAFSWIRYYGSIEGIYKSSVTDKAFRSMFPSVESIAAARELRTTRGPYERIRPDHLERVREFLDAL